MKYHPHKAKLSLLTTRGKRLNSLTLLLNVFGIILVQLGHNYILCLCSVRKGFPGSSAGKESSCNAGDLGSIPGVGRSPGGGKGYLLQYSGLENSMGSQRVRHDNYTTSCDIPTEDASPEPNYEEKSDKYTFNI